LLVVHRAITAKGSRQKLHDSQQKQSLVVRYNEVITVKESQQKPQGFAAKAIVGCSSGDHRKRLMTEAARFAAKAIVGCSLQ